MKRRDSDQFYPDFKRSRKISNWKIGIQNFCYLYCFHENSTSNKNFEFQVSGIGVSLNVHHFIKLYGSLICKRVTKIFVTCETVFTNVVCVLLLSEFEIICDINMLKFKLCVIFCLVAWGTNMFYGTSSSIRKANFICK